MGGEQESRVHINRNSKKKSGYEVELRDDGFYYGKKYIHRETKMMICSPQVCTRTLSNLCGALS